MVWGAYTFLGQYLTDTPAGLYFVRLTGENGAKKSVSVVKLSTVFRARKPPRKGRLFYA